MPAVAFGGLLGTGVVNQDAPHGAGGRDVEMRSILPADVAFANEPDVSFVHQRGRLQSVAGTFLAHVAHGEPVQFGVDDIDQLLLGTVLAGSDIGKQLRNQVISRHLDSR